MRSPYTLLQSSSSTFGGSREANHEIRKEEGENDSLWLRPVVAAVATESLGRRRRRFQRSQHIENGGGVRVRQSTASTAYLILTVCSVPC